MLEFSYSIVKVALEGQCDSDNTCSVDPLLHEGTFIPSTFQRSTVTSERKGITSVDIPYTALSPFGEGELASSQPITESHISCDYSSFPVASSSLQLPLYEHADIDMASPPHCHRLVLEAFVDTATAEVVVSGRIHSVGSNPVQSSYSGSVSTTISLDPTGAMKREITETTRALQSALAHLEKGSCAMKQPCEQSSMIHNDPDERSGIKDNDEQSPTGKEVNVSFLVGDLSSSNQELFTKKVAAQVAHKRVINSIMPKKILLFTEISSSCKEGTNGSCERDSTVVSDNHDQNVVPVSFLIVILSQSGQCRVVSGVMGVHVRNASIVSPKENKEYPADHLGKEKEMPLQALQSLSILAKPAVVVLPLPDEIRDSSPDSDTSLSAASTTSKAHKSIVSDVIICKTTSTDTSIEIAAIVSGIPASAFGQSSSDVVNSSVRANHFCVFSIVKPRLTCDFSSHIDVNIDKMATNQISDPSPDNGTPLFLNDGENNKPTALIGATLLKSSNDSNLIYELNNSNRRKGYSAAESAPLWYFAVISTSDEMGTIILVTVDKKDTQKEKIMDGGAEKPGLTSGYSFEVRQESQFLLGQRILRVVYDLKPQPQHSDGTVADGHPVRDEVSLVVQVRTLKNNNHDENKFNGERSQTNSFTEIIRSGSECLSKCEVVSTTNIEEHDITEIPTKTNYIEQNPVGDDDTILATLDISNTPPEGLQNLVTNPISGSIADMIRRDITTSLDMRQPINSVVGFVKEEQSDNSITGQVAEYSQLPSFLRIVDHTLGDKDPSASSHADKFSNIDSTLQLIRVSFVRAAVRPTNDDACDVTNCQTDSDDSGSLTAQMASGCGTDTLHRWESSVMEINDSSSRIAIEAWVGTDPTFSVGSTNNNDEKNTVAHAGIFLKLSVKGTLTKDQSNLHPPMQKLLFFRLDNFNNKYTPMITKDFNEKSESETLASTVCNMHVSLFPSINTHKGDNGEVPYTSTLGSVSLMIATDTPNTEESSACDIKRSMSQQGYTPVQALTSVVLGIVIRATPRGDPTDCHSAVLSDPSCVSNGICTSGLSAPSSVCVPSATVARQSLPDPIDLDVSSKGTSQASKGAARVNKVTTNNLTKGASSTGSNGMSGTKGRKTYTPSHQGTSSTTVNQRPWKYRYEGRSNWKANGDVSKVLPIRKPIIQPPPPILSAFSEESSDLPMTGMNGTATHVQDTSILLRNIRQIIMEENNNLLEEIDKRIADAEKRILCQISHNTVKRSAPSPL